MNLYGWTKECTPEYQVKNYQPYLRQDFEALKQDLLEESEALLVLVSGLSNIIRNLQKVVQSLPDLEFQTTTEGM